MCSFLVTNKIIDNIDNLNRDLSRRGPDGTKIIKIDGINFVHNLLHITGKRTDQPIVKGNTVMVYNGEVYNFCGDSDTTFVFDSIFKKNIDVINSFDGEYALAIYKDNILYLATDIFGTKPLFFAKENNYFGVCSYYSVLKDLGFNNIEKLSSNTILNVNTLEKTKIHEFNLNQFEETFDVWEKNFLKSIEKRITSKSFICLSSGYDSGALALAAKILGKELPYYCIPNKESKEILDLREKFLGKINYLKIDEREYSKQYNKIANFTDSYTFKDYNFKADKASIGLSIIFEAAKNEHLNVNLSGSGADEILTDYGIEGRNVFFMDTTSSLRGIFPDDLTSVFPWYNFFNGRQERYLYKEESVAGLYGIETRYPFLDRNVVQSFLSLTSALKNREYKSPLAYFFKKHNFPYESKVKRGFNL